MLLVIQINPASGWDGSHKDEKTRRWASLGTILEADYTNPVLSISMFFCIITVYHRDNAVFVKQHFTIIPLLKKAGKKDLLPSYRHPVWNNTGTVLILPCDIEKFVGFSFFFA